MRSNTLLSSIALPFLIPLTGAISLINFQTLTVEVPINCAIAYDSIIPSCTNNDFEGNAICSSACVLGLQSIALAVNADCIDVVVDGSTLLGKIFKGQIVPVLCPNNGKASGAAPKQTSAAPAVSTAQSKAPAQTAPTKQTTSRSPSAANSATTPTASTKAESSTSKPGTTQPTSESDLPDTTQSSSTTAAAPTDQNQSASSSAAAQQTPASTIAPAPNSNAGMTVQQQQIAAIANSGGGSPFDIIGYSATSAANQFSQHGTGMVWTVGALVWTYILLGR